jgi:tetratricopeptide (TPR) repeat protein
MRENSLVNSQIMLVKFCTVRDPIFVQPIENECNMQPSSQPTFGQRKYIAAKNEQKSSSILLRRIAGVGALAFVGFVTASLCFGNTKFYYAVRISGPSTLSEQLDWCSGKNDASPDQQISGCSALIDSGRGNDRGLSEALYNRGNAYTATGDFERAIADYDRAIRLSPAMAVAYDNRGLVYSKKNQFGRAIADYDEAIRLNPNSAAALHNRCWARVVVGHFDDALADCSESLRLRPQNAKALGTRGFAYLRMGAFDKSIIDYDAALQNDPKMTGLELAAVLYGRGLAKGKRADPGADADIAAAKAIIPDIAEQFAGYGLQ